MVARVRREWLEANIAASVTVRKLQTTGIAAPEEIRSAGADPHCVLGSASPCMD